MLKCIDESNPNQSAPSIIELSPIDL